jgi:hypothetical protein
MSEYHLQARRAVHGSCPRREETRLSDADRLDEAITGAEALAGEGFTVWVFRRTAPPELTALPGPLHLIATIAPTPARPVEQPARRPAAGDGALVARRR